MPPINADGLISEKKFKKLFSQPILVFAIPESQSAGYDVHFIFKNYLKLEFSAWLTIDDDMSLQPKMIMVEDPDPHIRKIHKQLSKKEFEPYWL